MACTMKGRGGALQLHSNEIRNLSENIPNFLRLEGERARGRRREEAHLLDDVICERAAMRLNAIHVLITQ